MKDQLKNIFSKHTALKEIEHFLNNESLHQIFLKGILTSPLAIFVALLYERSGRNQLVLLENYEEAAYFYNDLLHVLSENDLLFFPSSYKRSAYTNQQDSSKIVVRTKSLGKIVLSNQRYIIVTYPEAVLEKILPKQDLEKNIMTIRQGDKLSRNFLQEILFEYQFEQVDFVSAPGQFSIRGSLFDIFSFAKEAPFRIDFWGDRIESVRVFDIATQLSINKIESFTLMPNLSNTQNTENFKKVAFTTYLKKDCVLWQKNPIIFPVFNDKNFVEKEIFLEAAKNFKRIDVGLLQKFRQKGVISFRQKYQPLFNKNFKLLIDNLQSNTEKGYENIIFSDNSKHIDRLRHIFEDRREHVNFRTVDFLIHEGFVDDDLKIACYTEHQIFNRYHKLQLKSLNTIRAQQEYCLQKIHELQPGDYVVHIDHGIGRFSGLQEITVNNKKQEAICIVYKNGDLLYVNSHSLYKVSKYKGRENLEPKIDKLGGSAWQKLKQRTKRRIKDIAKDLIQLYAERKSKKGFAFSSDTYMQDELEISFIYKDTPDQEHTNIAVKADMERPYPMDRLICGDVGFGKTEIAIRAAFKAVADNKQAAVLVPTTILAFQHFNTFADRLKNFPCTVEYLSRTKTYREQKNIVKKLTEGKIDIIIGTHRLVSSDVVFKDLGLLIIDEEQKFGVRIKEKLRKIRVNVDTLTLTATPIPRTLQFSLMGARDLSIINTPPANRYPIFTEIHHFNKELIRDAISYEINRGGQVFFMHNRIQNIYKIQQFINRLLPEISTEIAHGQMKGNELENIMFRFMQGEFDVLISTSIIESGLDIPNANTIIINHAHHFGLSDLYQLRGRVGRSATKAFCYLLTPPVALLTKEARERLKTIETHTELGSGFNIAMKDLDIRGAGNLLGSEQSGFIMDIGLETYQKILDEALHELHSVEFKGLFPEENKKKSYTIDCQIDTDFEVYIPNDYIENTSERIKTYRLLNNLQNEIQLKDFAFTLTDRFGKIPEKVNKLMDIVRLRWLAIQLGFERIILKNEKLGGYFPVKKDDLYFRSSAFESILLFLKEQPFPSILKEKNGRLIFIAENIVTINKALSILKKIVSYNELKTFNKIRNH